MDSRPYSKKKSFPFLPPRYHGQLPFTGPSRVLSATDSGHSTGHRHGRRDDTVRGSKQLGAYPPAGQAPFSAPPYGALPGYPPMYPPGYGAAYYAPSEPTVPWLRRSPAGCRCPCGARPSTNCAPTSAQHVVNRPRCAICTWAACFRGGGLQGQ